MRTFCLKAAAFVFLQALILYACWESGLPSETNYLAAAIDKHNRLAQTQAPRIILVGGSNVALGIQSARLESAFGRPVVNMSLVARLGIEFMLNEVEPFVQRGDLVLLSFEYDLMAGGHNPLTDRQLLEFRPASARFLPLDRWNKLVTDSGFSILGGIVRRGTLRGIDDQPVTGSAGYDRRGFDSRGDYVAHYRSTQNLSQVPPDSALLSPPKISPISPRVARRIERFARVCFERGAQCVYSCPPNPASLLEPRLPVITSNLVTLAAIPHLILLDRPRDQIYPLNEFYDSGYHLTGMAAAERTRKLITELRMIHSRREPEKLSRVQRGESAN